MTYIAVQKGVSNEDINWVPNNLVCGNIIRMKIK